MTGSAVAGLDKVVIRVDEGPLDSSDAHVLPAGTGLSGRRAVQCVPLCLFARLLFRAVCGQLSMLGYEHVLMQRQHIVRQQAGVGVHQLFMSSSLG